MNVKEGDKLPDAKVYILDKEPKEVSINQIIGNDKVILFGVPGAFTSVCTAKHLPGFVNNYNKFKINFLKKIKILKN